MKKRSPKFHLNEPVYVSILGHVVRGRIRSISQNIEDEIDPKTGKKTFKYHVSYFVVGDMPYIHKGRTFFTCRTQYFSEESVFAANEEEKAKEFAKKIDEEEFICATNSAYAKMSMLSHLKTDDPEKKEFVKLASSFCKKLREFNKKKYGKQTPVLNVCKRGNFM